MGVNYVTSIFRIIIGFIAFKVTNQDYGQPNIMTDIAVL